MIRLLLIGAIPVLITLGIILFLARPNITDLKKSEINSSVTKSDSPAVFPKEITEDGNLTKQELLRILEASISAVNSRVDVLAGKAGVSVPQVSIPGTSSAPTSYVGPKVVWIPLGSSGSSSSINDYEGITNTETVIDTSNFPGYKNMYLEADFRIYQGNGTGYARLFNKTDGVAVLGSEISTTSESYGVKSSSAFKITSGKKTYLVQLKSATGYSVDLQAARVRVEF